MKKTIIAIIYFNDGIGGTKVIKAPVLLSIFQSEKLMRSFCEDPEKKYSVKEIYELRNKNIPVKEATIRRCLTDNKIFFETSKEVEIRKKKGKKTVMVINFTTLKPITKYVFDAVKEIWEDEE